MVLEIFIGSLVGLEDLEGKLVVLEVVEFAGFEGVELFSSFLEK